MASDIGGIVSIVLFVLACKNVVKAYKEKPAWFKVVVCVGLFFAGLILASLFLYALNPEISYGQMGESSVYIFGIFADLISLVLRFIHARKHKKKDGGPSRST